MNFLRTLLDRTAVLFLGVAAGVAIGYAFGQGGARKDAVVLAPEAAPAVHAPPAIAPPPPTASAANAAHPAAGIVAQLAAGDPAVSEPPMVDSVHAGKIVRVGVFGDSFGDGVWSALYRLLPAKDGYQVTKFSQPSTGFTRYRRLDLESHDAEQIADKPIDIAVISFGANDAQGVCDAGKCGALMGKYWQQVIGRRVEAYVAMLRAHGASVYWVGLPAMRDPAFDGDASAMDAFYSRLMGQLGVPYIVIRPLTVDADGHYVAYYRDADGAPKLLRAGDGIHMSMNGYMQVSKGLASRIRASVRAARATQPAEAGEVGG
jgi:hypothetical protein